MHKLEFNKVLSAGYQHLDKDDPLLKTNRKAKQLWHRVNIYF